MQDDYIIHLLVNAKPITLTERNQIRQYYSIHGPRWNLIAAYLPGRTPRMVKNCWHSMARSMARLEAVKIREKMSIHRLLN